MMGVMVRHLRTARLGRTRLIPLCVTLLLTLPALLAFAQGDAPTTRPVDLSDAPTADELHGLDRVKRGLGDVNAGSQEIVDRVSNDLRKKWMTDGKVQAVVIEADGQVDDFMRDSIKSRFAKARGLGAEVVILKLDTYGGLVTSGLDISRFIKRQSDLYTVCLVDDKAISAGCMIALSCNEIAMMPSTSIGDCGVIQVGAGGMESMGETERAKQESPVLAEFDDSARVNRYDPLLARSFVRADASVYFVESTDTAERRFVDAGTYDRLVNGGKGEQETTAWQPVPDVPVPLDGPNSLLTMSDGTARKVGLSTGTFDGVDELAAERGWAVVSTLAPSGGERLVGFLGSNVVRGLLMTVLFLGIYMSLSHPGTGAPEAVTAIVAVILFIVPWLTGLAQWYEVLMVLAGIGLLALEIFVIPGFGVAGISGLVLLVLGLAMTFVPPLAPAGLPFGTGVDWNALGYGVLTVIAGMVSSLLLWFWLSRFLVKIPYFNRMILQEDVPSPDEAAVRAARSAAWPTVGMVGTAVSDLRPGGTARFAVTDVADDTANADVISDRGFVHAGTRLAVVEVGGNRTVVRPVA